MGVIKDLLQRLHWGPFRGFVQRLPPARLYPLGSLLGQVLYHAAGGKRAAFERELRFIRSESADERRRVLREAFRILVCNELEVLCFPVLNARTIDGFVTCRGLEHLDGALRGGRGAMLLFAHFGANQMIMPAIGYRGYTMSQMSAPATVWPEKLPGRRFSPTARRALAKRWEHEQSLPVAHINIFGSLKGAFRCLQRNEVLGVAMDGGGGRKRLAVRMLGRKAMFSVGAIEIAMRTACAVVPAFMIREATGRNVLVLEPPLAIDPGADDAVVAANMQRFAARLEHYVVAYPSHYLNFLALRRFMAAHGDEALFPEEG